MTQPSIAVPSLAHRAGMASLLTAGVACWCAAESSFFMLAMLGAAAIGFTRRSLFVQVLSRGAAYLLAVPLAIVFALKVASTLPPEGPPLVGSGVAALALGAALWLTRPLLETAQAKRAFAPARFRGVFLAGATATASGAVAAAGYAVDSRDPSPLMIGFHTALAVVLVLAVRALLAMRTWGILLGAVTALALVALAPFWEAVNPFTLSVSAAPALLLWVLPLFVARKRRGAEVRIRVAVEEQAAVEEAETAEEVLAVPTSTVDLLRASPRSH